MEHFIRTIAAITALLLLPSVTGNAQDKSPAEFDKKAACRICHQAIQAVHGPGSPASGYPPDPESLHRIAEIFEAIYSSPFPDAVHMNNEVSCSGCHLHNMPELDASVESSACIDCHEDCAMPPVLTMNQTDWDVDPHRSHLGAIDCAVCHRMHSASKAYCLACHKNFVMPIPGG